MRSAISFLSLLAFGFLAAGVLTVIGSGPDTDLPLAALGTEAGGIHLGSLLIGMLVFY
jgi:hypothetical protein